MATHNRKPKAVIKAELEADSGIKRACEVCRAWLRRGNSSKLCACCQQRQIAIESRYI